jgi:poly(3-hydroxyalkanoate) synthetase
LAAQELIEELFGRDLPGSGRWRVANTEVSDRLSVPVLHLTADRDRIAPASTKPAGPHAGIDSGHVGMVVGSSRARLLEDLQRFLHPACRSTS